MMLCLLFFVHRITTITVVALTLLLAACSSPPKNSFPLPVDQFSFGHGGGMSGEVKTNILINDGQLHNTSSLFTDTTHLITLASEAVHSLFEQLDSLHIDTIDFKHPGNQFYFIRHHQDEVVWGHQNYPPPVSVQQFYDSLKTIVPKQP